jgi:hypothetical protein
MCKVSFLQRTSLMILFSMLLLNNGVLRQVINIFAIFAGKEVVWICHLSWTWNSKSWIGIGWFVFWWSNFATWKILEAIGRWFSTHQVRSSICSNESAFPTSICTKVNGSFLLYIWNQEILG